jgi:hypothetical protein
MMMVMEMVTVTVLVMIMIVVMTATVRDGCGGRGDIGDSNPDEVDQDKEDITLREMVAMDPY